MPLHNADPVHVSIDAYTSFPTVVGARSTLEVPGRLRLSISAGILPDPYLQTIDDTAVANNWYDRDTADLIETMLHNSLLVSAHLGWRPVRKAGFVFEVGYGFVGLGGGLTGTQVLSAVTGYDLSWMPDPGLDYEAHATLHRLEGSVGWEFVIRKHVHLQVDVGYSRTIAATTAVDPQFEVYWPFQTYEANLEKKAESVLHDDLVGFVHTPILAVGAGWRF